MATFLIVLLQFTKEGTPEWIKSMKTLYSTNESTISPNNDSIDPWLNTISTFANNTEF